MSNITNNTASSRFSEYTLDDYSTCKATANKTSPSANRVVAAMQATAHKVVTAFSYAAAFLSNMVLSVANLAIRAANFMHGRIFTKEAPAAKPVEIELEPKKEVLTITHVEPPKAPEQKEVLTITYVEPPKAPEQLAATEKSADQTAPKEEAPTVVDTKTEAETVVKLPAAGEELAAPEVASVTVEAVPEKMAPVSTEEKSQITLGKVAKCAALSILVLGALFCTAPRWVLS